MSFIQFWNILKYFSKTQNNLMQKKKQVNGRCLNCSTLANSGIGNWQMEIIADNKSNDKFAIFLMIQIDYWWEASTWSGCKRISLSINFASTCTLSFRRFHLRENTGWHDSCVEDIVFGEAYRKTSRFSEQSRTPVEGGSLRSHSEKQGES